MPTHDSSHAPAVETLALRRTFAAPRNRGGGPVEALAGVDVRIERGEIFGLLGPNGAGKTTTVEMLEGLLRPDEGAIEVLGLAWATDERELRRRLGIALQETRLSDKLSVRETITLFRSLYGGGRPVDDVLDVVQLREKQKAWVGKLSGGQQQRLAIACALVGDPDILFLDEIGRAHV